MLTSFFGNSKPAHFLLLGVIIASAFIWTLFQAPMMEISVGYILFQAFLLGVIIIGIILLDFIVSKNHLTRRNAYSILFYSCFIIMFPIFFLHSEIILANFFILLAIRRIISLRNDSNSEKKILDAALWITLASLFYFWSLLLFLPLWIAVIQKPNLTYKQMLIPIVGFFAVIIINTAFQLLIHDSVSWLIHWKQNISYDFSLYNSAKIFVPITLLSGLLVWTGFYRLQRLGSIPLKERPNYWMIFIITLVSFVIALCSPIKDGSEMIFLFAPTAILCAKYMEGIQGDIYRAKDKVEVWFKEIILWIVVVFGFVFMVL
ncbi:hypothetical protein EI546_10795 [Aequorivita sp. H23M31]|uniref:Beta-carotene 15,15'-monooxygenase n=1 Tax=Aequorivita ciconiae TaxID=2494375 RepID=A0A410G4I7_9FLAO|nr:DUF6427 family protein [Aequorivita sp. H23M31]QAA82180.1 hypothetical protein EI546_10795 [Aequorivita sp. H23M31]